MDKKQEEAFKNATSERDILRIYERSDGLTFNAEALATYLKQAKGDRTLKDFSDECRKLLEATMKSESEEDERYGASAPTFTRIAKGDDPNIPDKDKIKRPLDVRLLWAIWMTKKGGSFTCDQLYEANCYVNVKSKNKTELKAASENAGSIGKRTYSAARDKRTALYGTALNTIMTNLSKANLYFRMFSNFEDAVYSIRNSEKDLEFIKKALCEKRSEEDWNAKIGEMTSGSRVFKPLDIISYGTGDYYRSTYERVEHDVLRILDDETMFWVFVYCDPKVEVADFVYRSLMPFLFRDFWEPETMPDSVIKTTLVCTDMAQYEAYLNAFKDRKFNSLISVMYVETDPYSRQRIYEHILPYQGGKEIKSRFPELEQ